MIHRITPLSLLVDRQLDVFRRLMNAGVVNRRRSPRPYISITQYEVAVDGFVNHLTPNGHYMGRTAQLTSRCCILYIYSTNIRAEYEGWNFNSGNYLFTTDTK